MAHLIDAIAVDAVDVDKPDLRSYLRAREVISLGDKGGIGDGVISPVSGSDNWTALSDCAALVPGGVIKIPFQGSGENTYYFASFTPSTLDGIELDVDFGVLMMCQYNDVTAAVESHQMRFTRATRFYFTDLKFYQTLGASLDKETKYRFIGEKPVDRARVYPVTASGASPLKIAWASGTSFSADSFSASATNSCSFAPSSDASYHMAMKPCLPGDRFTVEMSVTGTPLMVAMIRGTTGYAGVYCSVEDNVVSLDQFEKINGSSPATGTAANIDFQGRGTMAAYAGQRSLWSIHILSWTEYAVEWNGQLIARGTLPGGAIAFQCGFGMYPQAGSQGVTIKNWTRTRGSVAMPGKFYSIGLFGDSITCPRADSYDHFMLDELELSNGLRTTTFTNNGVSGLTAAQIYEVMTGARNNAYGNAVDAVNYDIVTVLAGTNDIQAQTDITTFTATINAIIDYVQAAEKTIIIGVPPVFYTRGQSGSSRGQASSNYELGVAYRAAILRAAAEQGVHCIDFTRVTAPISPNYVNPLLTPDLTAKGKNVMADNIHPDLVGAQLIGHYFAAMIMAIHVGAVGDLYLPLHLVGTALNGWDINTEPPYATVSADGMVKLYGLIWDNASPGATHTNGTSILQLPEYLWPQAAMRAVAAGGAENGVLTLDAAGLIYISGFPTSTWISLDGFTWSIETRERI